MGGHDRCCVAGCDNDKRRPNETIQRGHVEELIFHRFPKDEKNRAVWISQVRKGLANFELGQETRICSNHFQDGKPARENPYPTLFLCPRDFATSSPKKRKSVRKELFATTTENPSLNDKQLKQHMSAFQDQSTQVNLELHVALHFHHINRESCVRVFTGLPSPVIFEKIFSWIEVKAKHMQYWKGEKVTLTPVAYTHNVNSESRYGPPRSLTLEQEFLLVLMRLRMGLLVEDLAFRFKITCSQVSCIFTTWIKLLSRELGVLIVWPSKAQVKKTMPYCFRKMYPNCRVIIDCTEVYTETPTALDIAAALWSDYKQHHTFKFLVAITPRGAVSWVSPVYGGRASDVHIVRNSGFLNNIQRYDLVMADRGFKIREDLLAIGSNLAIPPSSAASMQMRSRDVKETSQIANVRIHVERAIRRIKIFRILKQEMPLCIVPLADDIVRVCAALSNLWEPLIV